MDAPLRISIKTVGCRLNQAETAQIAAQFKAAGYVVVPFGTACEVCLIHGCSITANAEKDTLRAGRKAAASKSTPVIVIAGCTAETSPAQVAKALPGALIAGQQDKWRLPALLHAADPARFPAPPEGLAIYPDLPLFGKTRALVKAQDGCDFNCAYCVVPRARGRPRSRPMDAILKEVRRIADAGYREVVLTGANLGCYRDGDMTLVDILRRVEAVDGIARIRLSSIESTTTERAIIEHMTRSSKLCHFLHIPLQSGSDRILRAMGRRYSAGQFKATVFEAITAVPMLGVGTDIMVGFPGETKADFEATLTFVKELPFSNLHVFPFSPRPGTRAASMPGQVPAQIKKTRVKALLELDARKRAGFAAQWVGKPVQVLLEKVGRDGTGQGWTGEYLEARVTGRDLAVNQIVKMIPERVIGDGLAGRAVEAGE